MKANLAVDLHIPLTEKQIQKNIELVDDAVRLTPYAIMSNNAYERGNNFIPLPDGWKEITELRNNTSKIGLAFSVFEKQEGEQLVEVVVAFRGTDGLLDWIQNLIPCRRIQVKPASEAFNEILQLYRGKSMRIVATGHSLGGGLALHMSFVYPNIEAIVFNSSPVTKAGISPLEGNRRTNAWESGEILQIPRNIISFLRPRWQGIERIKFSFIHGLPFGQHGMENFALNLIKLGALKSAQLKKLTL